MTSAGASDDDVHVGIDLNEPVHYDIVFMHIGDDAAVARRLFAMLHDRNTVPGAVVLLSTTDVYGEDDGVLIDEDAPCATSHHKGHPAVEVEQCVAEYTTQMDIPLSVLRLPPVVGTGMEGILRKLVNGIYRGSVVHIEGNDARRSVIHAVDVARAARLVAGKAGTYNVTDGTDPTVDELIEALAHRLDDKRVFTVGAKRARRMALLGRVLPVAMNPQLYGWMTTTLTFDSSRLRRDTGFEPQSVVDYLMTHDYDESSL